MNDDGDDEDDDDDDDNDGNDEGGVCFESYCSTNEAFPSPSVGEC